MSYSDKIDLQTILNTPQQHRLRSEIPETPSQASTQSWDSQDGPRPKNLTPLHTHNIETSRDDRIAINTALLFDIPYAQIQDKLKVTERQIQYAKDHWPTPQKARSRFGYVKLRTPQRRQIET